MVAWLNFILFIGFVIWVRLLIGGVALLGGSYNLKEFFFNKDGGCKVANDEKRQKVFTRLKQIVQQKSFVISFLGIILLAFAVNLVELVCSAGLPAVYTQLALNDLSGWQYYAYILLYIFFFMIDDLFIFFITMTTLQMTGISTKYSRISKLIGGAIMIIIGILLIFKPEWLMFG
jgi:cytochrome c biogenesis protein CcdA